MEQLTRVVDWNRTAGRQRVLRAMDACEGSESLIDEEYKELKEAETLKDALDACGDLLFVVAGHIDNLGFDPVLVLKAVCDSNDSKWCYNEEDAKASVRAYTNDPRYTGIHYQKVNGKYVIRGTVIETMTPKILKGIHYKEPDFTEVYAEALRCAAGC